MFQIENNQLGVAIVGCGNVASFYCNTITNHARLRFVGVHDLDSERSGRYADYYQVINYESLIDVISDSRIDLVINLTNPKAHYTVSKACLNAGKHVYSEKPLAMNFSEAVELVDLAKKQKLQIISAPSRILAETAQTLWRAIRANAVGRIHGVYAEMDGGLLYRSQFRTWKNELGIHWPFEDEFKIGCTIEHAGYPISWLTAFFGPVASVAAVGVRDFPALQPDFDLPSPPPLLSIACLHFKSGVVARLTSSWLAPHNHSLRMFGDTGILSTRDVWEPRSPVVVTSFRTIKIGPKHISMPIKRKLPLLSPPRATGQLGGVLDLKRMYRSVRSRFLHLRPRVDFCLGPAELARSILSQSPCRMSTDYCLHNTEILLAIHNAKMEGSHSEMTTTFELMNPSSSSS